MSKRRVTTPDVDIRVEDVRLIREAYTRIDDSIKRAGRVLRTTHAGEFIWSARHKTALAGLRAIIAVLHDDVPRYGEDDCGRK